MNYSDKVKLAIANINGRLRELRSALNESVKAGVQSASISSGGASQSYTRMSLTDLRQAIADLENAKKKLLSGSRTGIAPDFTYFH